MYDMYAIHYLLSLLINGVHQGIRSRSSSITDAMMYKLMYIMFNVKVFYNMITALDARKKKTV